MIAMDVRGTRARGGATGLWPGEPDCLYTKAMEAPAVSSPHSTPSPAARLARAAGVGVIAGFTAGLFGVGGGIVIVPALVVLARYDQRTAHATSLAAIVLISASGAIGYARAGEVDWAIAGAMLAGGLVGAPLGARLLDRVSERSLQLGFAGLLVITAVRLALGDPAAADDVAVTGIGQIAGYAGLGLVAGLAAGLMGVGGGIVTVPVLTIVAGLPLVLAKGTSLAAIVPTAVVGTVRNHRAGRVDLRAAGVVGAGGVLSALAASQISLGLDPDVSSALFALLLLVTAVRMARRALAVPNA
jgi:uncharacterized protein